MPMLSDKLSWLESGMEARRTKRALVLTGAGASLDFGAPSTSKLTKAIKAEVWLTTLCSSKAATALT